MKNLFMFLMLFSFLQNPFAQTIENASFDSLYIGAINRVWNWTSSDAHRIRSYQEGDTIKATEPNYTFEYAQEVVWSLNSIWETPYSDAGISLQTDPGLLKEDGMPFETYLLNGHAFTTGADGYIDFKKCGSPFPYRPTKLKGYYQYTDEESATIDYGKCIVLLKKYDTGAGSIDTIGFAKSTMDLAVTTDWETFEIPITYSSNETPDSIIVLFYASTNPEENQTLLLDELTFDFTTNINESEAYAKAPIVYPNPNYGNLHIQTFDQYMMTFQLWNTKGNLLKSGIFSNSIDINDLADQCFILQLTDSDGRVFTHKIIKN